MDHNAPPDDTTPTLPGFIEERTEGVAGPPAMLLRVWCRWCCRWHTHGYTGIPVGGTTDRSAHCHAPDSPYKKTGYVIRVSGTPFVAVQGTMRCASAAQDRAVRDGRISEAVQRLRDQAVPVGGEGAGGAG